MIFGSQLGSDAGRVSDPEQACGNGYATNTAFDPVGASWGVGLVRAPTSTVGLECGARRAGTSPVIIDGCRHATGGHCRRCGRLLLWWGRPTPFLIDRRHFPVNTGVWTAHRGDITPRNLGSNRATRGDNHPAWGGQRALIRVGSIPNSCRNG
jgi:hypothetical protein